MKKNTLSSHAIKISGLVALFALIAGHSPAQWADDPNLDQIPRYLLDTRMPQGEPLSTVLTIGDWDNFSLGVDFAENNMAANPAVPTWFFTAYNTNTAHRTQDGYSWANNSPNFGATMRGDPVVAYDSLGNLFYENMYGASTVEGAKVISSSDNGATWQPAVTALAGNDKCWLACDQTAGPYANYVYATMTNNTVGNFARSTDHGATFTSTFAPGSQTLPGMMVCVGPNGSTQGGSVYVVTNSGSSFASTFTFYRSTDGGLIFILMSAQNFAGYVGSDVQGRNSVENMRTRPYPYIAADNSYGPNRGKLYLVYASNDPPGNGNKPDIWLRVSADAGLTWSSAKRVNDDVNPTAHHQWHPAIWCDKETGRLYIQWMDTRDTPTSDSAYIYATYTDDAGTTFVPNQRISNKKMKINCTTCGGGGTPRYQGDYNGVISNSKGAMLGWTDFRNGTFLSTTAYFPDYAMALDHTEASLFLPSDSATFYVRIPEVKLYTDSVIVSASVSPTPTTGSITLSFPSDSVLTTFPDSLPVKVVLSGQVPVGNYQAAFMARGPNGTPVHKRFAILQVKTIDVAATATPDSICLGAPSQLNAEASGGTPPYTYSWTPVTGLSDPTIANPVAVPSATTWYKVTVTDSNTFTGSDSVLVTILPAPSTPGPINGPTTVCMDSSAAYFVFPIPGATSYSWSYPADATITGQNTPSVNIHFGTTSGPISVIAGNACGTSLPSVLDISLTEPAGNAGPIQGTSLGCKNELVELFIDTVPGATTYQWIIPPDASFASGQGTPAVQIIWGATSGTVTVAAGNTCGYSLPSEVFLPLDSVPGDAGPITGKDTVCLNHTGYEYSIPVIPNAQTYVWSVPSGAVISGGEGTNAITIDYSQDAVAGIIAVFAKNDCGLGVSSSKTIFVSECAGISEHALLSVVTLFPNPVTGELNIRIVGKEKALVMVITNVTGQQVHTEILDHLPQDYTKKLDATTLPSGVYFVRMISGDRSYNGKFIVRE